MKLIINDAYIADNFPLPYAVDSKRLRSVIVMTQKVEMRLLLGDSLYSDINKYLESPSPETEYVDTIIEEVRMLHCMYVARSMFSTYYTDLEPEVREYNIKYLNSTIKTLEKYLVNSVVKSAEAYAKASESTDNTFDESLTKRSSIYYP